MLLMRKTSPESLGNVHSVTLLLTACQDSEQGSLRRHSGNQPGRVPSGLRWQCPVCAPKAILGEVGILVMVLVYSSGEAHVPDLPPSDGSTN